MKWELHAVQATALSQLMMYFNTKSNCNIYGNNYAKTYIPTINPDTDVLQIL